jgi:murein DD-endopeptidase MepM/ murein hydrolase activator NlpD
MWRGARRHGAVDIFAPRGTPVLAVSDGTLERLSQGGQGGLALYQRAASGDRCYYYAHLDRYAGGLTPGLALSRGQPLGAVGSTGNADASSPHLHFAVLERGKGQSCTQGTPVDPFPLLD